MPLTSNKPVQHKRSRWNAEPFEAVIKTASWEAFRSIPLTKGSEVERQKQIALRETVSRDIQSSVHEAAAVCAAADSRSLEPRFS